MLPRDHSAETIETFIIYLNHCEMSEQNRADALKVMECLRYIKNKMDPICHAIDAPDKIKIRSADKEETPDEIKYSNLRDKKLMVLRDDNNTAIHIGPYIKNGGKQARKALTCLIEQTEYSLTHLSVSQKIIFAEKLEFNNDESDPGCLDKRTAPAFAYAADVLSGCLPRLDNIISQCQKTHQKRGHDAESLFDYIMEFININNIHRCLYSPDGIDCHEKVVTPELIANYLSNILAIDGKYESKEEKYEDEYQDYTPHFRIDGKDALALFNNNSAIVKILGLSEDNNENWEHLLNQLLDPENIRPSARHRNSGKTWAPKSGPDQGKEYKGFVRNVKTGHKLTKKTATTLTNENMTLFGRSGGLLFDMNKIKRLYIETYGDQKYIDKLNKYVYRNNARTNNYPPPKADTTIDDIVRENADAAANRKLLHHNEILLRLNKHVIAAVVVNQDNFLNRTWAIRRKYQVMQMLDIDGKLLDVPILILSEKHAPFEYTHEMQIWDLMKAGKNNPGNAHYSQTLELISHYHDHPPLTNHNIQIAVKKRDENYMEWIIGQYTKMNESGKLLLLRQFIEYKRNDKISSLLNKLAIMQDMHDANNLWKIILRHHNSFQAGQIEQMLMESCIAASCLDFIDFLQVSNTDREIIIQKIITTAIQKKNNDSLLKIMEKYNFKWTHDNLDTACRTNNLEMIIKITPSIKHYISPQWLEAYRTWLRIILPYMELSDSDRLRLLDKIIQIPSEDMSNAAIDDYAGARDALIEKLVHSHYFHLQPGWIDTHRSTFTDIIISMLEQDKHEEALKLLSVMTEENALVQHELISTLANAHHWIFIARHLENREPDDNVIDVILAALARSVSHKTDKTLDIETTKQIIHILFSSARTAQKIGEISETMMVLLKNGETAGLLIPQRTGFFRLFESDPLLQLQYYIEKEHQIFQNNFPELANRL